MITDETIRWIIGIVVIPGLAWSTVVIYLLRDIKRSSDALLRMHTQPDVNDSGFGTAKVHTVLGQVRDALWANTHYLKWFVKVASKEEPPPPPANLHEPEGL